MSIVIILENSHGAELDRVVIKKEDDIRDALANALGPFAVGDTIRIRESERGEER